MLDIILVNHHYYYVSDFLKVKYDQICPTIIQTITIVIIMYKLGL